jgi:hypothetical protein
MKFYQDSFDCQVQSDEVSPVTETDYDEIMMLMAQEHEASEAYAEWSAEDQKLWEAEQARLKNWTGKYSSNVDGDTYNGLAI